MHLVEFSKVLKPTLFCYLHCDRMEQFLAGEKGETFEISAKKKKEFLFIGAEKLEMENEKAEKR